MVKAIFFAKSGQNHRQDKNSFKKRTKRMYSGVLVLRVATVKTIHQFAHGCIQLTILLRVQSKRVLVLRSSTVGGAIQEHARLVIVPEELIFCCHLVVIHQNGLSALTCGRMEPPIQHWHSDKATYVLANMEYEITEGI